MPLILMLLYHLKDKSPEPFIIQPTHKRANTPAAGASMPVTFYKYMAFPRLMSITKPPHTHNSVILIKFNGFLSRIKRACDFLIACSYPNIAFIFPSLGIYFIQPDIANLIMQIHVMLYSY